MALEYTKGVGHRSWRDGGGGKGSGIVKLGYSETWKPGSSVYIKGARGGKDLEDDIQAYGIWRTIFWS